MESELLVKELTVEDYENCSGGNMTGPPMGYYQSNDVVADSVCSFIVGFVRGFFSI